MTIYIFRIVERLVKADPWQPAQFRCIAGQIVDMWRIAFRPSENYL